MTTSNDTPATPRQTAAADALRAAGLEANIRARAYACALGPLREAVYAAWAAGIPQADVKGLVSGSDPLPAEVAEHLRVMIRRTYRQAQS
jgi:hypothetical protein